MLTVDMVQLGLQLDFTEGLFVTRENGERAYPILAERFQLLPENQALLLSFPPIQLLDASFVDECIVRLGRELMAGKFGDKGLILQGLTEDSKLNINSVIALQQMSLAFLCIEAVGGFSYVGRLETSLWKVLQLMVERDELTAPELAELLDLEVNAASNRLKRLYDRHLLWRQHEITEKGLQYIYRMWQ